MTQQFKKGDRVRRVGRVNPWIGTPGFMKEGGEYTVKAQHGPNFLILEGGGECKYSPSRFVLVKPATEPGTPRLPKSVAFVDGKSQLVEIDGEPFPYYLSDDSPAVLEALSSTMSVLTLRILVPHSPKGA